MENIRFEMKNGAPWLVLYGYENLPDQWCKVWKANSATPYVKSVGFTFNITGEALEELHKVMGK